MTKTIFHQASWAKSALGTNIQLYKKTHTGQAPILFIGGVHGDEPEGVELAEKFLLWLQEMDAKSTALRPWILIPCLNVDGYSRLERTNGRGVDLNRNFPSDDWSPEHKAPRYFPGPHPNSEPETQALVQLIAAEKPQLIVHFHSWEPCVVYTGPAGKEVAEMIAAAAQLEAREDIGYPTPGSLGQYGWMHEKIPVICIEEQEKINLDQVWPRFAPGLQKLMLQGA